MKKLKIGSLFSGIGAWELALENMDIKYELKFFSEVDASAIKAYTSIHNINENLNIGDITKYNENKTPDIDVLFYSPPCQSFSNIGKKKGVLDSRGVLFYDALRIIEKSRPNVCIMENVKALASKRYKTDFEKMLLGLQNLGYKNSWFVLNSRNFGLPQNRERIFIVSKLNDEIVEAPKALDENIELKTIFEVFPNNKYYLKNDSLYRLSQRLVDEVKLKDLSNLKNKIIDDTHSEKYGGIKIYEKYAPCLRANRSGLKTLDNKGFRRLTPKECWRLQGISDKHIKKCYDVNICDTQLYKMAGNTISINVLESIYKKVWGFIRTPKNHE